jgi:AcrR family transcriptional regulator
MKSVSRSVAAKRTYRMQARAVAAAETGRRILQAVLELHLERFHDQITLDDVAERAGVTPQTVLRRFGSKERLVAEAARQAEEEVMRQRFEAPVGNIPAAIDNLLEHYEQYGASTLRLLAQEDRVPQFGQIADRGREGHYAWVDRTFGPFLETRGDREGRRAKLIVLTDVYVWKLLRLDLGLDRAQIRTVLIDMLRAVVQEGGRR